MGAAGIVIPSKEVLCVAIKLSGGGWGRKWIILILILGAGNFYRLGGT
jgi:hypothetical protein